MNSRHPEEFSIGKITSGVDLRTLALKTIDFVRRQLPIWRDDPYRPEEKSEFNLNLHLSKFLNARARNEFSMIQFNIEEPQSGRRKSDMAASPVQTTSIGANQYTIYNPFLVFECKRLPAPEPTREREYVTGGREHLTGGIQRFKLGLHGMEMELAGMIGYIQKRSVREWHADINDWIANLSSDKEADICIWNTSEKLMPLHEDVSKGLAYCQSTHSRIGNIAKKMKIELHHSWIVMNQRETL